MKLMLGTNLFNRTINKMGFIVDATDKEAIRVKTISGPVTWNLNDCDVIEEYDE